MMLALNVVVCVVVVVVFVVFCCDCCFFRRCWCVSCSCCVVFVRCPSSPHVTAAEFAPQWIDR
jgi:hypothetical protein